MEKGGFYDTNSKKGKTIRQLSVARFDNGETRIYDATPLIRGDWFGQLKDVNMFNTVRIAGISVEWAGGQDVCLDEKPSRWQTCWVFFALY